MDPAGGRSPERFRGWGNERRGLSPPSGPPGQARRLVPAVRTAGASPAARHPRSTNPESALTLPERIPRLQVGGVPGRRVQPLEHLVLARTVLVDEQLAAVDLRLLH